MGGGKLRAAREEREGVTLHLGVDVFGHDAARYYLVARDVLVVPCVGLGGRGEYGAVETLVLAQALGKRDAAYLTRPGGVFAPCRPGQVAAHYHLYLQRLALQPHGDHGVGDGHFPVGDDVGGGIEESGGYLI